MAGAKEVTFYVAKVKLLLESDRVYKSSLVSTSYEIEVVPRVSI